MKISIIGSGRLGGALAIALAKTNYEIDNLFVRGEKNLEKLLQNILPTPKILQSTDLAKIKSDVVIITTQDSEIKNVADELADKLTHKPFVFHTSGSLSSEVLEKLKVKNIPTGSIHPLVSISDSIIGAERFEDVFFCVEGDAEATKVAEKIVADLGGKSFSIETKNKILYHAAAVTACGHLVALLDVAFQMLSKCGLDEVNSKEILLPLIESTINNLKTQSPSEALTGTFARADSDTFEKHVNAIKENLLNEELKVYLQLGERSLHLAKEQISEFEKIEELQEKLSLAKKNLKC